MHMRKKKWARPELADCAFFREVLRDENRGQWRQLFPKQQPLYLELGCGKGVSTAQMTFANRDCNFLAMDISSDVLGDTRRNIVKAYGEEPIDNVIIVKSDIAYIDHYFSPEDRVERIYINFCNPWPRPKHKKRRLTHPRQLLQYRTFLADGGEIRFKTDDDDLFRDSLKYFAATGFETVYLTGDLHQDGFQPNYVSEHEQKFTAMGIPIKFAIFKKLPDYEESDFLKLCLRQDEDEEKEGDSQVFPE